jgi:hypothetical protein
MNTRAIHNLRVASVEFVNSFTRNQQYILSCTIVLQGLVSSHAAVVTSKNRCLQSGRGTEEHSFSLLNLHFQEPVALVLLCILGILDPTALFPAGKKE